MHFKNNAEKTGFITAAIASVAFGAYALWGCGPGLKPNPNQQIVTDVAPNDPARAHHTRIDNLNPYIGQSGTQGNPYYPEFSAGSTSSSRTPIEQDNHAPLYTEEIHYTNGQRYLQHTLTIHGQEHRYLIAPAAIHELSRIKYHLDSKTRLTPERLNRVYEVISAYTGHTQIIEQADVDHYTEQLSELEQLLY